MVKPGRLARAQPSAPARGTL